MLHVGRSMLDVRRPEQTSSRKHRPTLNGGLGYLSHAHAAGHHGAARRQAAGAAFGPQTCSALRFAGLFVILFPSHLLLDAAAFDELATSTHGFLDGLF